MRTSLASPLAETAAGAIAEAVLRSCVHCGMCNATCPTYQLTGDELDGPRGRIYLMKQALEGEAVGRLSQTHLDRCLSCRACETTCPSGVEYHRLLDIGREAIAGRVRRPWRERLARAAIRAFCASWLMAPLFRLRALLSLKSSSPRVRTPSSARHARKMSLLRGCVQSAAAPHFNAASARVFDRVQISLAPTSGVGCCGAVAFHTDAPREARRLARGNIDAWSAALDAGSEAIIINASGCAAFIRDYVDLFADDAVYAARARRVAAHVRDPVEVLSTASLEPVRPPKTPRIAVHDPCTLRNGPGLEGAVANLLARLGYAPQAVADSHLCCGSAGAYSLLQPRFANRLRADKLDKLNAGTPSAIYTANIGCWMHLGATSRVPVRHWIEAVDDVL